MFSEKNFLKSDCEKLLMLVFMLTVSFMLNGCPLDDNIKDIKDMTPKEKGVWMLSIYNSQYNDYKERVKKGGLTESEKNILRAKKKILGQVYPLIKIYIFYVDSGRLPTDEMESSAIELLNKIIIMD